LYAVWIKIDESLPWIELESEYQTRVEAKREAKNVLDHARIKVVRGQRRTKQVKVLATIR
jgi:hypothetical protein